MAQEEVLKKLAKVIKNGIKQIAIQNLPLPQQAIADYFARRRLIRSLPPKKSGPEKQIPG